MHTGTHVHAHLRTVTHILQTRVGHARKCSLAWPNKLWVKKLLFPTHIKTLTLQPPPTYTDGKLGSKFSPVHNTKKTLKKCPNNTQYSPHQSSTLVTALRRVRLGNRRTYDYKEKALVHTFTSQRCVSKLTNNWSNTVIFTLVAVPCRRFHLQKML